MNPQDKTHYDDGAIARLWIWLFRRKMARALGQNSQKPGYDGFVDLSLKIMAGRDAQAQQRLVAQVLASLVPSPVLWLVRRGFNPDRWVCEANAWFAKVLFPWLVGECELKSAEFTDYRGQRVTQRSNLHIKKCRYLENSNCVGMCVNMCKLPTEQFFTEQFGIPVSMTPNFEDYSCEMVFGQMPIPLAADPDLAQQPCLVERCAIAQKPEPCPKLPQSND